MCQHLSLFGMVNESGYRCHKTGGAFATLRHEAAESRSTFGKFKLFWIDFPVQS
jgi:hypothetical protein